MAKVTVSRRCNGPFQWESVSGSVERRLQGQGLCGKEVSIEYDDDNPISLRLGELAEKVGFCCVSCSKGADAMVSRRDALYQKAIKARLAGEYDHSKGGSKEFEF